MNEHIACAIFARLGNIDGNPYKLLQHPPTERQLEEAYKVCQRTLDQAYDEIRKYHNMPPIVRIVT